MGENSIENLLDGLLHLPRDAAVGAIPADTELVIVEGLDDGRLIAIVKHLPELRALLTTGDATVSDGGLAVLSQCRQLVSLDLEWSTIGDAGLPHLAAIPTLEWVDVSGSHVTPAGIEWLRQARPDIEVDAFEDL